MFAPRNIITYLVTDLPDLEQLEAALQEAAFAGRGKQELSRSGFVAPVPKVFESRVVDCHGVWLIALHTETALLPASVVRDELDEKVDRIEQEQSRKVYRKEKLQLKDEVILSLLPRAFPRKKTTRAVIDPAAGRLYVEASSHAVAEELLNQLRQALGSLAVRLPQTQVSADQVMTHWVNGEAMPEGWALEDEARLCDPMSTASKLDGKGQDLLSDEIQAHLAAGYRVRRLALQWQQQLHLVLHEDLSLHRLRLSDEYREQLDANTPEDMAAALETEVWRFAAELNRLTGELFAALGGLSEDLVSKGQADGSEE